MKTAHKCSPKLEIEDVMKEWPSGTYTVFECRLPNEIGLVAIGYKYNSKKVLCFVATKGAGSTKPGKSYKARFADSFNNVRTRAVLRPQIISNYFETSNVIDVANQARQNLLGLERLWLTNNCWFRAITLLLGFIATDTWNDGVAGNHSLKISQ